MKSLLLVLVVAVLACTMPEPVPPPAGAPAPSATFAPPLTATSTPTVVPTPSPVRIAAAGDIACDPLDGAFNRGLGIGSACRQASTAGLLQTLDLDAVLLLGDIQYEIGARSAFDHSYDPSWGALKSITRPAVGNHEYGTRGAAGYFSYFGEAAGDPARGYYSYNLGGWRLIALNSNCVYIGGCHAGSPQEQWLRADLAAHPAKCTLAYWHHPRFSSGLHGSDAAYIAFWQALYDAGADLVLAGHDHTYERFAPQDASGRADAVRGLRSFVVGTGGRSHYGFPNVISNSEVRNSNTFGVLLLVLEPDGYSWEFVPEPGAPFTDSGRAACH